MLHQYVLLKSYRCEYNWSLKGGTYNNTSNKAEVIFHEPHYIRQVPNVLKSIFLREGKYNHNSVTAPISC